MKSEIDREFLEMNNYIEPAGGGCLIIIVLTLIIIFYAVFN